MGHGILHVPRCAADRRTVVIDSRRSFGLPLYWGALGQVKRSCRRYPASARAAHVDAFAALLDPRSFVGGYTKRLLKRSLAYVCQPTDIYARIEVRVTGFEPVWGSFGGSRTPLKSQSPARRASLRMPIPPYPRTSKKFITSRASR